MFDAPLVAARFDEAAGTRLAASPTLLAMISRMQADAGHLVEPVKLLVGMGGRVRPFVAHPEEPTCLYPKDMAGRRDNDLITFHLAKTGSYPSTHAMVGMLMAMVLGEALPRRADAVMARGLAFGESRMVCGFHYYSDVMGGRIAGAALYARLQSDAAFRADMEKVKQELAGAR